MSARLVRSRALPAIADGDVFVIASRFRQMAPIDQAWVRDLISVLARPKYHGAAGGDNALNLFSLVDWERSVSGPCRRK